MENKISEFATAYNKLVDVHNDTEEPRNLTIKLADLVNGSHSNNVKLRGIAETVPPLDLEQYVQQLIATLLPSNPDRELIVDHDHSIPKLHHLPDRVLRNLSEKIHFYNVKDNLTQFALITAAKCRHFFVCRPLSTHDLGSQTAFNPH